MARPSSRKAQALRDYIEALTKQFPEVYAKPMQSSSGIGDYWVRVEVPEPILLDVVDTTSALSYDWRVERGVDILASVTEVGDNKPPKPYVRDLRE